MNRIAVAMSGGVDSSVAAWLLTQEGHQVIGVTMKLVEASCAREYPQTGCCSPEAIYRARTTCHRLSIPHYTLNFVREFEQDVVRDFREAYANGRTPNPCLRCNEKVKFGALLRLLMTACGVEYVATGHYATRESANGRVLLLRGADGTKDQSYALYGLTQDQLSHALFPLGKLTKKQVRRLAHQHSLPAAETPESQDLCFVPDGDYRDLLSERIAPRSGPICDQTGRTIGHHDGLHNYTVGQRCGLGISAPRPLYVIDLDAQNNTVTVGPKEELPRHWCLLRNVNWVSLAAPPAGESVEGEAEVRYRSAPTPASLTVTSDNTAQAHLPANSNTLTPGQSLVLYQGSVVVAGGVIEEAWN